MYNEVSDENTWIDMIVWNYVLCNYAYNVMKSWCSYIIMCIVYLLCKLCDLCNICKFYLKLCVLKYITFTILHKLCNRTQCYIKHTIQVETSYFCN